MHLVCWHCVRSAEEERRTDTHKSDSQIWLLCSHGMVIFAQDMSFVWFISILSRRLSSSWHKCSCSQLKQMSCLLTYRNDANEICLVKQRKLGRIETSNGMNFIDFCLLNSSLYIMNVCNVMNNLNLSKQHMHECAHTHTHTHTYMHAHKYTQTHTHTLSS